jgi:hypothetical protein
MVMSNKAMNCKHVWELVYEDHALREFKCAKCDLKKSERK